MFPVFADRAKNAKLWDVEGKRYIDFAGGIAVLNTGHIHPKVNTAVAEQMKRYTHVAFQVLPYQPYIELAERLNQLAPGPSPKKSIFFNSGAEAVENAIKIARAHTKRQSAISFVGGFHGRSVMALGLTGKVVPYKVGFGNCGHGVHHLPFPIEHFGISVDDSLKALANLFKSDVAPTDVAAIIIEPVQGEGGFYQAPVAFLQKLRSICDEHGICLITDEVQTGFGRTGKLFATEYADIEPDMITIAKSMAGGYPISGVIGKADVMDSPVPGSLGSTYGGSPIGCVAALAVLDVIKEENLLQKSNEMGDYFQQRLEAIRSKQGTTKIGDIRHLGGMIAFELINDKGEPDADRAKELVQQAIKNGLILLSCGLYGNVIRILAPLTIEQTTLDEGFKILERLLE